METDKIFKALPHVNEIWVKGNEFHLHPHCGGERLERNANTEPEEEITTQTEPEEETITPNPVIRKGRPKK